MCVFFFLFEAIYRLNYLDIRNAIFVKFCVTNKTIEKKIQRKKYGKWLFSKKYIEASSMGQHKYKKSTSLPLTQNGSFETKFMRKE